MHSSLVAISWEPELRGLIVLIIGISVLCGSIYLLLGTNLGARLGFLVALTGLAGWMTLMGVVWWIYGIGLKGPEPSWEQVPGRTVIQDTGALVQAGVLDAPIVIDDPDDFAASSEAVAAELQAAGWQVVDESAATFGQASSAGGELLEEEEVFAPGEFEVTAIFETGGDRYPKIGDSIDFLAFFHEPRYALVEVAPFEPLYEEPGRAPTPPRIDESRQRQYVYMVRDLGARRQPAAAIAGGSAIVFLALCWMLHRRDRLVAQNRAQLAPAG